MREFGTRVAVLTALGYGALLLPVAVTVGGVAGCFAVDFAPVGARVAIALVLVELLVARPLFLGRPSPEGVVLGPDEAWPLLELVEKARVAAGAQPLQTVVLSGAPENRLRLSRRFGPVGRLRATFVIGLPSLDALTLEETAAAVTSELAAHAQGGSPARRIRRRAVWLELVRELSGRRWSRLVLAPFVVVARRYAAATSGLSRECALAGDADAAGALGAEALARALVRLALAREVLDAAFWPAVLETAERQSDPPGPYTLMPTFLARIGERADADRLLGAVLHRRRSSDDGRPALAERLAVLGVPASVGLVRTVHEHAAAERLLGSSASFLRRGLDREWAASRRPHAGRDVSASSASREAVAL